MPSEETATDAATVVRLSYPGRLSEHAVQRLHEDYYRSYLRRAHDTATAGEEWDEFTDVGCCGSQTAFTLRVEGVDGGGQVGADTAIEYETRATDGKQCAWDLQNDMPDEAGE